MSRYSVDDFLTEPSVEGKAHICLHKIKDYEMQVQIPMLSKDEIPLEYLEMQAFAGQVQGAEFEDRYAYVAVDEEGNQQDVTCGPLILIGMYEGFLMLLAGHQTGAVPSSVVMAYGSFMVACARPYFEQLSGCEL